MIEKLSAGIYRIAIPLPRNPLKALNSYFIRGDEKNLLIDTGFNRPECKKAIENAMQEIGFSMKNTDLFITHAHNDHSGLVGYLATPETKVYGGNYCAQVLMGRESGIERYYQYFVIQSGLSKMGISPFDSSIRPGDRYGSEKIPEVTVIRENDVFKIGDYRLQCIATTGHTPDHMCLYEPEHKILFSGDHILDKITPNNTIWDAPWNIEHDYLENYLNNIEKIAALDVEYVFPGHRRVFNDCNRRIKELEIHHQRRLESTLSILGNKKMTGAEVASKLKWDLVTWDEFPPSIKFFATGEALSHLTHLVFKKVLIKELDNGVVYYSRV